MRVGLVSCTCIKGHLFDGQVKNRGGFQRTCSKCGAEHDRAYRQRKKLAA